MRMDCVAIPALLVGLFSPAFSVALAAPSAENAPIAAVHIEGPITGGKHGYPYSASIIDLKPYGYTESEYFVSGRAHTLKPAEGTTLGADAHWMLVPAGEEQPYKTRILVRKPPADKFNGTVVIEFMQEYFGSERDTDFRWTGETLLREGFGWVGVSLHRDGVNGPETGKAPEVGGTVLPPMWMTVWDPERYGSLSIPSTEMAYDILTQVARAVGPKRPAEGIDPFEGLQVKKLIAGGDTIAAERLSIYIDGVQPQTNAFDGFYLKDLGSPRLPVSGLMPAQDAVRLRADTRVPVMVIDTPTNEVKAGIQPEGPNIRVWTPAGASHTTGPYMERVGKANVRDYGSVTVSGLCAADYANTFPLQYVMGAAFHDLKRWVDGGARAPDFPQIPLTGEGKDRDVARDEFGNPVGGVRTPWVDVPVAHYEWKGECLGGAGRTYPFDAAKLKALYGTPADYVAKFSQSAEQAVQRGVLLPDDEKAAIAQAKHVTW